MNTIWLGLGGALGTIARYRLDVWIQSRLGTTFPYGTLAVNVLGSFLLALLMSVALRSDAFPQNVRLVLATGVLGGFTTYSTFNFETLRFLQEGAWSAAGINVAATLLGCLLASGLGWGSGSLFLRA